jgi:CubicO group peptidase (beta-lactamase class C family)
MTSGIDCREWVYEAFKNQETCYYQLELALGFLKRTEETTENAFEHINALTSAKPSGKILEYSSVISRLVKRVTGLSYAENIEREIWRKIGTESDALITQTNGAGISHAGISSTLRDLARYGYMFSQKGVQQKMLLFQITILIKSEMEVART